MPVEIEKDFFVKLSDAYSASNTDNMRGLICIEIAKVIVNDREEMLTLLSSTGTTLSRTPNDNEIISAILKSGASEKFQNGIAYLIAKENKLITPEDNVATMAVNPVAVIAKAASAVLTPESAQDNKCQLAISLMAEGGGIKKKSNWAWWAFGITVVVVGGVLIIRHYKKKQPAVAAAPAQSASPPAAPPALSNGIPEGALV